MTCQDKNRGSTTQMTPCKKAPELYERDCLQNNPKSTEDGHLLSADAAGT